MIENMPILSQKGIVRLLSEYLNGVLVRCENILVLKESLYERKMIEK